MAADGTHVNHRKYHGKWEVNDDEKVIIEPVSFAMPSR
jgi:hypothetical protein